MKANYFLGNQKFLLKDIPVPDVGAEEVLIRVAACGICGTDVHIYHGSKGSAEVHPPVVLGHELAGVVERTGAGVTAVKAGDHVSVDPNMYCGTCHFCRIGKKQLCENLYAVGVNRDGGFAEYCVVPQSQCYQLKKEIPLKYGAMAEPLACCIHGMDRVKMRAGDSVCVVGGGAIGLLMVQLARLSGASRVVLSEPVSMRREVGLAIGADAVIDPFHEDVAQRLQEILGTDGADVVIECTGNSRGTAQAFQVAKKGATVLLFSVPVANSTHPLSLDDMYRKELTVVGSMINPDTQGRAVELINSGKIQIEPILTHSFPVEQLEEAILTQQGQESLKVIIEF